VLKGVLFEIGGSEPIQTFREKKVKFDGASAVSNDEVPAVIAINVAPQDG
jgi:hypothetical protein